MEQQYVLTCVDINCCTTGIDRSIDQWIDQSTDKWRVLPSTSRLSSRAEATAVNHSRRPAIQHQDRARPGARLHTGRRRWSESSTVSRSQGAGGGRWAGGQNSGDRSQSEAVSCLTGCLGPEPCRQRSSQGHWWFWSRDQQQTNSKAHYCSRKRIVWFQNSFFQN